MMNDLKFRCYNCSQYSTFEITSENRGEVMRLTSSGEDIEKVRFICVNCGMANEIDIELKTAMTLLERLASDDPAVQDAIDRAKGGDYGAALDIAMKKLGF